jgi:hypothetical protein
MRVLLIPVLAGVSGEAGIGLLRDCLGVSHKFDDWYAHVQVPMMLAVSVVVTVRCAVFVQEQYQRIRNNKGRHINGLRMAQK